MIPAIQCDMMPAPVPSPLPETFAAPRHGLGAGPGPDDASGDGAFGEPIEGPGASARLLALSRPIIDGLYRQIGRPSSMVLLADRAGMILGVAGQADFLERIGAAALRPGVAWSAAGMGAKLIGAAASTGMLGTLPGDRHASERGRSVSCITTPIFAPPGGTLGIVDVGSDARENLAHAGALLRTTAELIEYRLLETLDTGFLVVHFHTRRDALADPLHALAIFDEGGRLVANNRRARAALKLRGAERATLYDACFATPWPHLVSWAAQQRNMPFSLQGIGGRWFIARAGLRAERRQADSCLGAMILGDPRIALIVDTLRACAAERTPLLFEGEMGTGKAYFAQAFHADHRPSTDAPFVMLDCSTLAAGDAGEEELERAWSHAADGILFLVEIEALAAAQQARLFEANEGRCVRVICASRQPLASLRSAGRLDLRGFDAAGGRILSLPPLRERGDFDALVRQFVRDAAPERPIYLCPDALALLRRYRWPGNLRELRNQLRLILALMGEEAGQLCPEDIPAELLDDGPGGP